MKTFVLLLVLSLPVAADEVEALLADLDAEDYQARERATRAIEALGEAALEPLRAYLAAGPGPEGRLRAKWLLDRIEARLRSERTEWGEPVSGLRARVTSGKEAYAPGAAIVLTLEIRNESDHAIEVVAPEDLDIDSPGFRQTFDRAVASLRIEQISGQKPIGMRMTAHGGGKPARTKVRIEPGALWSRAIDLAAVCAPGFRPEEGEYSISWAYGLQSKGLLPGAERDLESNGLRIRMAP